MVDIKIPGKAEIKVEWREQPHNFSDEGVKTIRNNFAKKYDVDSKRVKVVRVPLKMNKEGKMVVWTDGLVENILNTENQRKLFKEWLEIEGIKNYDWDKIVELDDIVNSMIVNNITDENCGLVWEPIELGVSNFLSYGDNIKIRYEDYKGLTLVTSDPANMGGKTNLSVDAPMFVLFGTTTKTDKLEDVFNIHSGKDTVETYMTLSALGDVYKIKRTLTRKPSKTNGFTVTQKVQYYKIFENGSEFELADDGDTQNQEGEQARETNKLIKSLVGSKNDFENIICATSDTLGNLINSAVIGKTERGKILTKFIGLEGIEKKEIAIKAIKSKFEKTMKSNLYTETALQDEIDSNKLKIVENTQTIELNTKEVEAKDQVLKTLESSKTTLIESKSQIDPEILKVDSISLNKLIADDTASGVSKKAEKAAKTVEKEELKDFVFDKEAYDKSIEDDKKKSIEQSNLTIENKNLVKENENLEKGKTCPTCNRPMEGVDNEPKILANNNKIAKNNKRLAELTTEISDNKIKKSELEAIKDKIEKRDKLELAISKLDVDMSNLREKILANKAIVKKYEENKENIDKNNQIDLQLNILKNNILTENNHRTTIIGNIERLKEVNKTLEKTNDKNSLLIDEIKAELVKLAEINLYLSLVESKRGISKIVLKNTLPIINYTINEMLEDVCDFDVELDLNSSNDVEIYMIRNGVSSKIKASSGYEGFATSLALRVVFSRLSTLPKPNFLILDEILGGKVATDNLEKVQLVIEKVQKYFGTIFFITHDERTKDWCNKSISVYKQNNISYIK